MTPFRPIRRISFCILHFAFCIQLSPLPASYCVLPTSTPVAPHLPTGFGPAVVIEARTTSITAARPRRISTAFPSPGPSPYQKKVPTGFAAA
jgi:hypothetical protein